MKYIMLFEGFYDETSWTDTIGGKKVTIKIQDVQRHLDEQGVPVTEVPVSEIFHLCAHRDKRDRETMERSERSSLDYPIIVARGDDGEWRMVLDGMHRLLKAKNHGHETIKARVLDLRTAPPEYRSMFC